MLSFVKYLMLIVVSFSISSCKKKVYHSFTDDERAYLVYNMGDTFKLKDENIGDTLIFNVSDRYDHYKKDTGPSLLPSRKEHYMEEAQVSFSGTNNSWSGYIYIL